ncbi:deoxyribose-phosphate aldolase [Oceanithermus profundus DSM 14977]|uniref:Deoxyribose-phosphate aldolase n=1 Tax=Oceanithermus profundus (strain DSM 14977 / NBRC 100410 / VKM B-2274 / 506) TaxID=670487 RepID=E4U821_OCEP5|nr:deoxyribose-phosphate aldolase [Oceanithermus profundus]ADR36111.1 deoxyribose-phosphate aldolase [Oceanithermus profundus DSM 14977]
MDTELAKYIDHTLLKPTATPADIERLCREADEHYFYAVCVNPAFVPAAKKALGASPVRVAAVIGFPLGANASQIKAAEAALAVSQGADELDMVIPVGRALAGDWDAVAADVRAVREAAPGAVLKVILETGYLDEAQIRRSAEAALAGGADFLKTSTGFGPRGASIEDVRLLAEVAGGRAKVKAAGGIRTREDAWKMIEAGASRLGTSSGVALVEGGESRGY